LRVTDQVARLDAAFNLPGDQQIVLIKKGFPNVKPKGGKRNVDSAAGERKLDCPGGVAELSSANLKGIQVLIAPAERDLQGRVEFGQTRLFSDQQSASHRLLPQHARSAPGMDRSPLQRAHDPPSLDFLSGYGEIKLSACKPRCATQRFARLAPILT